MKSFYNKSIKKLTFKKSLLKELASTRENFKSKFNFHKETELNLLDILKLENEVSDLNQCMEYYNSIKNSEFKSDSIKKIHKMISMKKEEIVLNDINRIGVRDMGLMKRHFDDYKLNNWAFSFETILKLRNMIN